MLIIEIALGIVLGVLALRYLSAVLAGALLIGAGLLVIFGIAALIAFSYWIATEGSVRVIAFLVFVIVVGVGAELAPVVESFANRMGYKWDEFAMLVLVGCLFVSLCLAAGGSTVMGLATDERGFLYLAGACFLGVVGCAWFLIVIIRAAKQRNRIALMAQLQNESAEPVP